MTAISRVLLFTEPNQVEDTVAALAAITDTEPVTMRITRRDHSRVVAHLVEIGGTVIEVAPGEPAVPALIELLVPDLPAAADRLSAAGVMVTPERGGARVKIGGLTVAVRLRALDFEVALDGVAAVDVNGTDSTVYLSPRGWDGHSDVPWEEPIPEEPVRDAAYYAQFSRAVEAGDYEVGGPLEPGPAWEEREK